MSAQRLAAGFVALVDAAPLIIAQEMGFAEDEGLALDLRRAPSWSMLRDMLAFGQIDAAHMLAALPVAAAMGLGGVSTRFDALQVMSVNGTVIGLSQARAGALRASGFQSDFTDAAAAGRALVASAARGLRIGVPLAFSMHAELLHYWLDGLGLGQVRGVSVHTVPPLQMAQAIAAGEIDAFCVGEPWGSMAVAHGVAELLLPGSAIWSFAPEKVLAVRQGWAEAAPDLTGRLMRAVWRAGRWLGEPANRTTASEILARPACLDVATDIIDRALSGNLLLSREGDEVLVPQFLEFHAGAAAFPWRSQAGWIGARMAGRLGMNRDVGMQAARAVFRSDLYRRHLAEVGAEMPTASDKVEGALAAPIYASGTKRGLILARNLFFDGREFDPTAAR